MRERACTSILCFLYIVTQLSLTLSTDPLSDLSVISRAVQRSGLNREISPNFISIHFEFELDLD